MDPVELSLSSDGLSSLAEVLSRVEAQLQRALEALPHDEVGREHERWYWAAPVWLDHLQGFGGVTAWLPEWGTGDGDDEGGAFREHAQRLAQAAGQLSPPLGRRPTNLAGVLAKVTLAGPAICALRSLRRSAPDLTWDAHALLSAAAKVGACFRTLFNVPESIALLRAEDGSDSHWLLALDHGLQGNLAALFDEQVHVLTEAMGVADAPSPQRVERVATELRDSLSIRTSQLQLDQLHPRADGRAIDITPFKLRPVGEAHARLGAVSPRVLGSRDRKTCSRTSARGCRQKT